MYEYHYSKDKELKQKIITFDWALSGLILIILFVVSSKTGKDFVCFMIFLAYCFLDIVFSYIVYFLSKKGLN